MKRKRKSSKMAELEPNIYSSLNNFSIAPLKNSMRLMHCFNLSKLILPLHERRKQNPKSKQLKKKNMANGIPQVHLTNNVKLNGHTDLEFTGSSFLIEYNDQTLACAHAQVLSSHFGVSPGVDDKKDIPSSVDEWLLSPRVHSKGLFKKKLVISNPMKVTKYLNIDSPSKILLMDVDSIPEAGNYAGMRLSDEKVENEMSIMLATCPKDRKDITQQFYFGQVVNDDVDGLFAFMLNDEIPHGSVPGSPVGDSLGQLLGMIVAFQYVEGHLVFFAERTTQLKKDLLANFGAPIEPEPSEEESFGPPYISLSIDIEGDGFASPKELDLRAQIENTVEQRNLGKVADAGTGGGKMDITFAEANDLEGIEAVLVELNVESKTEIHQHD